MREVLRLLILEDDPDDHLILAELLEEIDLWQAECVWCARYEEAVARLGDPQFDLALVDFRLGAHTGLEFLGEPAVRAAGIPVIVFTGAPGSELDLQVMAAGAVDFIPKEGLTSAVLERSIRYAIEARRRHGVEARFRALIERSRDLITIIDGSGTILYISPSVQDMLGYAPEDRLGAPSLEEVHPEDSDRVGAALWQILAHPEEPVELRYRVLHADGSWRLLETVAQNLLTEPAVGGIVVNSRDITDRVQQQERILFQARLLDEVGQAVVARSPDGAVTYWNRAAETLYGWSRDAALGRHVRDVTPAESTPEQEAAIEAALREGRSWTGEFPLRRRDGSVFQGLVTESPVLDEDERLIGIIGTSSDISERKMLEEQLRLAQRIEAVGRLAAGVAHDFHNILTAVRGHAELLLQDLPPGSPLREDVLQIQQAGRRAGELTRQLLAFSRKQMLEQRVLDLPGLVAELEPMLLRLIPAHCRLHILPGPEGRRVKADPTQIHQVILNLALNAADAIAEQGDITIRVDTVSISRAEAARAPWDAEPGRYVRLVVEDTGEGMTPETMEHVFEPFFTTKAPGKGTGLGLATVFGIVKQSQGHVFLDSTPGEGTSFRILLPMVQEAAEPEAVQQPTRGLEGDETILLVEDDEAVRRLAQRVLERAGYRVITAENGHQALEVAAASGGDLPLVLSDMVMPAMGGVELARRFGELFPATRVILMSGYAEEDVAHDGRALASAFVRKPFTREDLLGAIRRTLDSSSRSPSA